MFTQYTCTHTSNLCKICISLSENVFADLLRKRTKLAKVHCKLKKKFYPLPFQRNVYVYTNVLKQLNSGYALFLWCFSNMI